METSTTPPTTTTTTTMTAATAAMASTTSTMRYSGGVGVGVPPTPGGGSPTVVSSEGPSSSSSTTNGGGGTSAGGGGGVVGLNATAAAANQQQHSSSISAAPSIHNGGNNNGPNSNGNDNNGSNNSANNLKRSSMRLIGPPNVANSTAPGPSAPPAGSGTSGGGAPATPAPASGATVAAAAAAAAASSSSSSTATTATAVIDTAASTVSYHRRPFPDAALQEDMRYNGATPANGNGGGSGGPNGGNLHPAVQVQHNGKPNGGGAGSSSGNGKGGSVGNTPTSGGHSMAMMLLMGGAAHNGSSNGHHTPTLPNGVGGTNGNSILTQAGLEEYSRSYYEQTTMYHHQKQSSYAQSEGYHSYVSSSDSSSTPFLDRLRQDSELLLSRSSHNWSQQDLQQLASSTSSSIGDNHSSAESNSSSTETLKWLGSMSDVSVASHATSTSALSSAGSTSQLIAHSSRVRTPQRHNSESILYMSNDDQSSLGGVSQSTGSLHHTHMLTHRPQQQQQQPQTQHSVHHHRLPQQHNRHSHLVANSGANGSNHSPQTVSSSSAGSSPSSTVATTTAIAGSAQQQQPSPTGSTTQSSGSASNTRSSRSNNRLFPISTYTEPPGSGNGTAGTAATGSGSIVDFKQLNTHNWQSVADRINELEKHQQAQQQHGINLHSSSTSNLNGSISGPTSNKNHLSQLNLAAAAAAAAASTPNPLTPPGKQRYTYFDPSKTHRISNPSLKAFQKNAVISYFERQQQHARESIHNRPNSLNLSTNSGSSSNSGGSPGSSSTSPQSSMKAHAGGGGSPVVSSVVTSHSQRSSISSAYSSAAGSMMELSNGSLSMGSYSPPSSLAVQQQLDKLAVNNLRNQLASVHTMNLLNKVVVPPSPGGHSQQNSALTEQLQQHHHHFQQQQHQQHQQMISNATLILSSSAAPINGLPSAPGVETHSMHDSHEMISTLDGAPPPPPPPRNRASMLPMGNSGPYPSAHMATVRRTSSASEYSSIRDKLIQQRQQLSKDLLGPMIMGPIIALDDWVPERPPKNPMLRIPSPELPPPPPVATPTEDVLLINQDEPLPPPPPELLRHMRQLSDSGDCRSNSASRRNSFAGQTNKKSLYRASTFENLSPANSPPAMPQLSRNGEHIVVPPMVPKKPQQQQQQQQQHQQQQQQMSPTDGGNMNVHRRPASSMAKTQTVPSVAATSAMNGGAGGMQIPMHHHQHLQHHRHSHQLMAGGRQSQEQNNRLSLPLQQPSAQVAQSMSGMVMFPAAQQQPPFVAGRQSDTRISVRKRTHNSQQIPVSEYLLKMNGAALNGTTPPPPLKPRMPVQPLAECNGQQQQQQQFIQHHHHQQQQLQQHHHLISMGSKRSNSKASYLPRQPRDKLHSDPDHGSYKLTLTSNEDCINHGSNTTMPATGGSASSGGSGDVFPEEIITSPKCNLPDVLPPGVKYSLYSNNNNNNNMNNNNNSINNHHNGHNGKGKHVGGPHSAPIIATANSLKSLFNFNSSSQTSVASSDPPKDSSPTTMTPPSLYNGNSSPPLAQIQATSPKYTSQSSFDLKKTQILESLNGAASDGGQCNGYHLYNGGTGHTAGGILGVPATTNSGATATLTSIASIKHTTVAEEPQHGAADDGVPPPLPSTPLPVLNGTGTGHLWPSAPTVHNCNETPEKSTNFEPHQQWNGLVADHHHHQNHHQHQHLHQHNLHQHSLLQQHSVNTVASAPAPAAAAAAASSTVAPVEGTPLPSAPECSAQLVSEVSSVGSIAHDDAPALSSGDAAAAPANTTTTAAVAAVAKEEGEGESRSTKSTVSSSSPSLPAAAAAPETTGSAVVVNGLDSRDNNHVGSSNSSSSGGDSPLSPALERVTKEINFTATSVPQVDHSGSSESNKPVAGVQQLLQRTEIVLRVQAPTSEAASQTESEDALGLALAELTIVPASGISSQEASSTATVRISSVSHGPQSATATVATSTSSSPLPGLSPTPGTPGKENRFFNGGPASPPPPQTPPPPAPRKLHPEEIDCDKLSHDLVSQLSPSDKLHTILAPKTFKSSSDYVSDLFNIQIAPRPLKKDASTATPTDGGGPQKSPLDILTSSSTYFQISEPKAKLMARYSREMTLINGDCCDLTKKKEELVQRLGKKLLVLTNEQTSIAEESNANDLLGNDVALKVTQKVRPNDASKFRSYVDDVGYITMLLLSLSGRLARTDNALHSIESTHPDKKILEAKRERLLEQLDEAKQLKDDIDRRGAIIARILEQALTIEEYADYDYFINMKAKLIVDSREIADKIKLGEEQLAALKDTLVQSEC